VYFASPLYSKLTTMHAATVLYVTRLEGQAAGRTYKEICLAAPEVSHKELGKCFKRIQVIICM
jgi:hypothetical protein